MGKAIKMKKILGQKLVLFTRTALWNVRGENYQRCARSEDVNITYVNLSPDNIHGSRCLSHNILLLGEEIMSSQVPCS